MRLFPEQHNSAPWVEKRTSSTHEGAAPVTIAPNVLSLPTLDPRIPIFYVESCNAKILDLGKSVLAAGYTLEDSKNKPIQQIIHEGVNTCIGHIVGQHIRELIIEDDDGDTLRLWFSLSLDTAPAFLCHDQLEAMHSRKNGLIEYALSAFYKSPIPIMTPGDLMGVIQMTEWLGYENEQEYLEEMNEEDIDVLRLKDVLKVIPQWSLDACYADTKSLRNKLKLDALNRTEKKLLELVDQFVHIALGIEAIKIAPPIKGCMYNGRNQFAAIMFLDDASPGGLCYQVLDNLFNMSMENNEAEDNSLFMLTIHPQHNLDSVTKLLHQCNKLLDLITLILPFLGESL